MGFPRFSVMGLSLPLVSLMSFRSRETVFRLAFPLPFPSWTLVSGVVQMYCCFFFGFHKPWTIHLHPYFLNNVLMSNILTI